MSFGLTVLAVGPTATLAQVRAMVHECHQLNHGEGDLDPRIVAFYDELRLRLPDSGGDGHDTPWADELYPGIDHVHMYLRYGQVSDTAIELIAELAAEHDLALYDPQGDEVHLPTG